MTNVLVADDEAPIAHLLQELLQDAGYDVRCAGNGELAFSMAKDVRPDLVITDVMMPFLRGPDLIRAMEDLDNLRSVPVILMSAVPITDLPERACDHLHFILKPFNLTRMLTLVQQLT